MNIYFRSGHERAFGTYPLKGEALASAIRTAIAVGYRAFDTAQMYGNEAEVGAALAQSGVARADLCITTKVDHRNFSDERFLPSVEQSLRDLRVDSVDVLLLHWPPADGDIAPSLRLLEAARLAGFARAVGVSNFTAAMMRKARDIIGSEIAVNQVEFHPLLDQSKLLAAADETRIPLSSYCSVARGEVFKHAIFGEIGKGYGKTAGQVVLRWILQKGVPINTMSTNPQNIAANFDVMDFTLSSPDLAAIDRMTAQGFRVVNRAAVPWAPEWD